MPYDDDDLADFIRENLAPDKEEADRQLEDYLRNSRRLAPIRKSSAPYPKDIEGPHPCVQCKLGTNQRYLDLRGVCRRCRISEPKELKLEHLLWFLKEIERLRTCVKEYLKRNPELGPPDD